jgi:hypothetical protein
VEDVTKKGQVEGLAVEFDHVEVFFNVVSS